MTLEIWLTFVAASSALLLIPGPTVLLVLSYALSKGRSVAVASAAGVAFGDLVAMTASLMGLGALVLASAAAFTVLKWLGAVYLVWLGIKMVRTAPREGLEPVRDVTSRSVFGHTAAVTALNPKSIAFFIAFAPAIHSTRQCAVAAVSNTRGDLCDLGRSQRIGLCARGRQAASRYRPPQRFDMDHTRRWRYSYCNGRDDCNAAPRDVKD